MTRSRVFLILILMLVIVIVIVIVIVLVIVIVIVIDWFIFDQMFDYEHEQEHEREWDGKRWGLPTLGELVADELLPRKLDGVPKVHYPAQPDEPPASSPIFCHGDPARERGEQPGRDHI